MLTIIIREKQNLIEFVEYNLRMKLCMKERWTMNINSMASVDIFIIIKIIILVNLRMEFYMEMESYISLMGQFMMEFLKEISLWGKLILIRDELIYW